LFFAEMSLDSPTSLDRYENELIDRITQSLSEGNFETPVEKLRLLCLSRGAAGKER
jgi:hypothetical protein